MIDDEGRDRAAHDPREPRRRDRVPEALERRSTSREVFRLELEVPLLVARDRVRRLRERRHALGEEPVVDDADDLGRADDHHLGAEAEEPPAAAEERLAPVAASARGLRGPGARTRSRGRAAPLRGCRARSTPASRRRTPGSLELAASLAIRPRSTPPDRSARAIGRAPREEVRQAPPSTPVRATADPDSPRSTVATLSVAFMCTGTARAAPAYRCGVSRAGTSGRACCRSGRR